MIINIFAGQMDYIFFFYGASFIALGAVCFAILKRYADLPWLWLGLFGFIHGINEWLDMIALSLGDSDAFRAIRIIIMIFSFVCLVEFGRRAIFIIWKNNISPGIYVILGTISLFGVWFGWQGINSVSRYCFGLTGGILSAIALFSYKGGLEKPLRKLPIIFLKCAGMAMFLYGLCTGLVVPFIPIFPANVVNVDSFVLLFSIPVQFFRAVFAFGIAIFIVFYAIRQSIEIFIKEENMRHRRLVVFFAAGTVVILFLFYAGWKFVDYSGIKAGQQERNVRALKAEALEQFVNTTMLRLESASASTRAGQAVGLTMARDKVDELQEYFALYPYVFFVSPEGIIFLSSRPEWNLRSMRDITYQEKEQIRDSGQFGNGPWDNLGFENKDDSAGTILFRNKLLYFSEENLEGLPGWKIYFAEDKSAVPQVRFMLIMIFLSFFVVIVIIALFIFKVSLDALSVSASEMVYEALVEGTPDCIQLFDKDKRCISINKNGLDMLNKKREDVVGKTIEEFWPKEYMVKIIDAVEKVLRGEKQAFEVKMAGKNGEFIGLIAFSPVFKSKGTIEYFISIVRDMTKEWQANEKLIHSSKMTSVGALATGFSHEFNNVLEIILGNAELAHSSGDADVMKKALRLIIDTVRRAEWIIKTILDFSGSSSEKRELVDLVELIKQNVVFLNKVFETQHVSIETQLNFIPKFYCNPGQLSQVFVNIMINARDAMRGVPDKKLIVTSVYDIKASEILITFSDTGVGIREGVKDKIFGAFVTTKGILGGGEDRQPGMGLGLFVAYGIIKQHGGNITFESQEGKGSKFCISLPFAVKEEV